MAKLKSPVWSQDPVYDAKKFVSKYFVSYNPHLRIKIGLIIAGIIAVYYFMTRQKKARRKSW